MRDILQFVMSLDTSEDFGMESHSATSCTRPSP